MSKQGQPVRVLPRPPETEIQIRKNLPKAPGGKPTKVRIVPAGTPIPPNWSLPS